MISVRAAAKINLHLGVGAPRDDGFHPLRTVYQAVGLCDDVSMRQAEDWDLTIAARPWVAATDVPLDGNIVERAVALLVEHSGRAVPVAAHIDKGIPVAGGLAGGSADAAAALVGYDRLADLETTDEDLLRLGAELGSDVPFALLGGTALGTGRGELVEAVQDGHSWWWVLIPSDEGLSTPAVYRRFDELAPDAPDDPPPAEAVLRAISSGDPGSLAAALHNDLQPAALDLRPELADAIADGERAGALRGIVSGSGPTVALLCADADSARHVAGQLLRTYPVALVTHGPVAGAHVIAGVE